MISVDTQKNSSYLHSLAWRDDESYLSSGIVTWFFPCSFICTLNAGMSNTLYDFFVVKS